MSSCYIYVSLIIMLNMGFHYWANNVVSQLLGLFSRKLHHRCGGPAKICAVSRIKAGLFESLVGFYKNYHGSLTARDRQYFVWLCFQGVSRQAFEIFGSRPPPFETSQTEQNSKKLRSTMRATARNSSVYFWSN